MTNRILIIISITFLVFQSCRNEVDKATEDEHIKISEYIKNIDIDTITENGIYYIEDTLGDGDTVLDGDFVSIDFCGCTIDNNLPDKYDHTDFNFVVGSGQIIEGINQGILFMREGGTGTFIIPFKLAYYSPNSTFNNYYTYLYRIHINNIINVPKNWEINNINNYIQEHNYNVQPDTNGFCYIELKEGTGNNISMLDKVKLEYNCKLLNDDILFSSDLDQKLFTLNYDSLYFYEDTALNRPLYLGLTKMKEYGQSVIIIPSNMAFGNNYIGTEIPPYSTFIFEINSISVLR